MDTYKHACPFCGQKVDYTADYCGKQMVCPVCGKLITFPAVPPGGKRKPLQVKQETAVRREDWKFSFTGLYRFLRDFEHWNIVSAGAIPFVIIVVLLIGSHVLKKTAGEAPAAPKVELVQKESVDPEKEASLDRLEDQVKRQVASINAAKANLAAAEQYAASVRAKYQGRSLDPYTVREMNTANAAAQKSVAQQQRVVDSQRQGFENAFAAYQSGGGKIDFRQQIQ